MSLHPKQVGECSPNEFPTALYIYISSFLSICLPSLSLSLSLSLSFRSTTDLDYSSFLIQESIRQSQKKKGKGNEEGEEEESESPGKEEYRQTLLNALSRNRSQPRQKGVLSFKAATPSTSGKDNSTIHNPHPRGLASIP